MLDADKLRQGFERVSSKKKRVNENEKLKTTYDEYVDKWRRKRMGALFN